MKFSNKTTQAHMFFTVDSVGANRGMHYYNFSLVSALNKIGASVVLISTPETAVHLLRPGNVSIRGAFKQIYGSAPKWIRGLNYTLALLRIAWWAYRERPAIVHFHFYQIPLLDYLLLRLLRWLRVCIVTTVHDVLPIERGTDFVSARGKIYHHLYTVSSGLILNSQYALDALTRLDPALSEKSVLIAQGGYLELYPRHMLAPEEAKARIGLKPGTPTLLVFGTIKPNKRLDLVVKAMVDVLERYPQAQLVVAGKLQDRNVAQDVALAHELGVAANIHWRQEYVTDEELVYYFGAADVVVFPYEWIYQSAVLLMAMSFCKAIVATAVGGNKDTIQNNVTGILVPVDDPVSMATAILRVLDDEAYGSKMGQSAHEYITSELSWEKIASSTLDFYHWVLND